MYRQQQEQQRLLQNSQGRPNMNMRQPSSGHAGWGSPSSSVNRPSLLDMSGKLRNDPSMRSPPAYGPNRGSIPGSSRGGGLLPSPPVGFRGGNNKQDMLGQIDSDIDELVAAKVRLQQAMLSAADAERGDQQHPRQGFQRQGRYDNNEHQQPHRQQQQHQHQQQHHHQQQQQQHQQQFRQPPQYQQQQQQQDRQQHGRGYPLMGGPPDRRPGSSVRPGSGMRDGRGGRAGGGRGPGGGGGGGLGMENRERRGNGRSDNRGQDKARKRGSSEIYDPARPTDDETGPTSIGRPVDDLQVTIRQQSRGRAVVDDGGPARKRPMQSSRPSATSTPISQQKTSAASEAENDSSWFCHVCSVTCRNIKVYQTHMTGKKHLEAMQKIREVATFQSDQAKARLKAQNYLSKLDGSSGGGSGGSGGIAMGRNNGSDQRMNQRFCRECNRYFRGDRFDHLKTDAHKDAKKRSKPHCNACNLSFKTTQKYVQHCKGELHKKRRDERIHDAPPTEEENYVTVDAVGFEDDIDVDAALIEMQLEAEEMEHSLETKNQDEDSEEVIVLDSGDDKEPSEEAEADSALATVGTELPDMSVVIESEQPGPDQKAQLPPGSPELPEGGDQTSRSEPLPPEVDDVGHGPDSGSDMPDPKMTLTFDDQPMSDTNLVSTTDNQPLSGVKSVSEVSSEIQKETASEAVFSGESKIVAEVGSSGGSDDPVKAGSDAEQVNKSDQQTEVSREGKGEEDKPAETVHPTPEPANDPGQPEAMEDQQEEPSPQEEIKELVFDPNKSVGEEYLISVTGFFCKLCHKFLTTEKARRTHCRGKSHFQALKAELEKQKAIDSGTVDQSSSQSSQ